MKVVSKSDLTPPKRRLVELMQSINFGRIEGLPIRGGEPVLDASPKVVREIKIGGENGPRAERTSANFALKEQVVEMLEHFSRLRDGTIEVLEVKHGLPFRMLVAGAIA